jgi:hypothetical protein
MSTVENFCSRQGNYLTQRLVFQGEVVRDLNSEDNVCHQLHDRWMASSGREVGYRDFRKSLRFESKDGAVYVWLHRDPTTAIVAGIGALGLTTAAAVRAYRAWQNSKAPESDESGGLVVLSESDEVDCNPATWEDAPANTKPSTFEYSRAANNVPAHLLLMYHMSQPLPSIQEFNRYLASPEKDDKGVALQLIDSGDIVKSNDISLFMSAFGEPEFTDAFKQSDLRLNPMINRSISSQTSIVQKNDETRKRVKCGDDDFSANFDTINEDYEELRQTGVEDNLTYDYWQQKVMVSPKNQCVLYVPTDSEIATDTSRFDDIDREEEGQMKNPTRLELTSKNITEDELFSKRIENRRKPNSKSLVSYRSLVEIQYEPQDDEKNLVFFLDNPRNFDRVTFNCNEVTITDSNSRIFKFNLAFVAFRDVICDNSPTSNVATLVNGQWVYYGGVDENTDNPPQHLRKMVPGNDLNSICAVPYILIFTRQISI